MEERIGKIYGYCRISTKHQEIGRQQVNILRAFPDTIIFEETHSGGDYSGCIVLDREAIKRSDEYELEIYFDLYSFYLP